jgi:AAA domain
MSQDSNSIASEHGIDALRDALDHGEMNGHAIGLAHTRPWWRDPATIPPRQFLFGRHYIRRAVGATIAAGGRGKTTLSVFEAVTMAVGFDLTTRAPLPGGPLRPWLLNGEEEQDELDRRAAALCQHYRITEADLGGRLFAQSVRDQPMRIAVMGKAGPAIDEAVIRLMVDFIERNGIDVFMVDPLVSFHNVPENDNSAMDKVIKQGFGAVAGKTNAAGEVFHHPGKPKPNQPETVVEDGRGASSILWAVRSARVLNFMTPADAEKLGMSDDERKLHIRIANGKANMAPLGKAKWMKIEVENLPNGDQVACGSPWAPPDPFENVTTADVKLAQKLARTGAYRDDSRSPEWFGYALAPLLNLSVVYKGDNNKKDLAKLKSIIETWKTNKVLDVEPREDEHRKAKLFIVPGPAVTTPRASRYSDDDDVVLQ